MPNNRGKGLSKAATALLSFLLTLSLLTIPMIFEVPAFSNNSPPNTINALIQVTGSCFISLNSNAINFGQIPAGASTTTTRNSITVLDPFGNVASNILVDGSNWISSGTSNFFVTNTIWDPSNDLLANGNALQLAPLTIVDTHIQLPAPNVIDPTTNAPIFFGLSVPALTPLGIYTQNIVLENSC